MKILCEGCGKEIEEGKTIIHKWMEDLLYFCSKACEAKHRELEDPEVDDELDVQPGPSE